MYVFVDYFKAKKMCILYRECENFDKFYSV